MGATLLIIAASLFLVASVLYVVWILRNAMVARRVASSALMVGTIFLGAAAGLVLRDGAASALSLTPQVALFVLVGACAVFLGSRAPQVSPVAGPTFAPFAWVVTLALVFKAFPAGAAMHATTSIGTVTVLHVGAAVLGFALFAPAYVLSALFLDQQHRLRHRPSAASRYSLMGLEQNAWRLLIIGFPLYTLGIVLGAVWQRHSGGEHVEFKPEHLLAAVSWCIYAFAIYRRLRSGWRGRAAALALMVAFVLSFGAVLLYAMR